MFKNLKYYKPKTIAEAAGLYSQAGEAAYVAGGTDILVEMKKGIRSFDALISLSNIAEIKKISENVDSITIGAGVTHRDIVNSGLIKKYIPSLSIAASQVGSSQIRNVATVAGNLCTAASCADTAPVLLAYNAFVNISDGLSERQVSLNDFLISHHNTSLKSGEIMTSIIVPKKSGNVASHFVKFGLRDAMNISVATAAIMLGFENGNCNEANIVIGACAPTPVKSQNAGNVLLGKSFNDFYDEELIKSATQAAAGDTIPIDDIRGSAVYRRNLVQVLVKRALENVLEQLKNSNDGR